MGSHTSGLTYQLLSDILDLRYEISDLTANISELITQILDLL